MHALKVSFEVGDGHHGLFVQLSVPPLLVFGLEPVSVRGVSFEFFGLTVD